MIELTSLRNIGTEMERKLKSVGIETAEDLREVGSKVAFSKLFVRYPNICLVHLYTLEGAISDTDYNELPEEVKRKLKEFCDWVGENVWVTRR